MAASAIVVGAGPGGLMAAERLARGGVAVRVFDRTPSAGRKFLLAGRSGLNLTHSEPPERLLDRFGTARDRLAPAVRAFDADALREWARSLGEPTFVGTSGRVFPESMRANGLLRAWLEQLSSLGVEFSFGQRWVGWVDVDGAIGTRFEDADGVESTETCDALVLALGGGSWPTVGSDGRWVEAFEQSDIVVSELRPSNSGFVVDWSARFVETFEGRPLKNLVVRCGNAEARGEAVITATGVEGGVFYAVSGALRDVAERDGSVVALLDLHPDLTVDRLAERLASRRPKDSLSTTLRRSGLDEVELALVNEVLRAPAQRAGSDLPSAGDVSGLAALLKALPMRLVGPEPIDRAISTAGGVDFDEVDERFMLRRRPGTFVVGEMLDWEAPTGGYLLQATFSMGVAAGDGALEYLQNHPFGVTPRPQPDSSRG